jgi:putative hemolysin
MQDIVQRNDFKFLSNKIIETVLPEIKSHLLSVDNMSFRKSTRTQFNSFNGGALAKAVEHLNAGGVLFIFPSGAVSHWKFWSPEGWFRVSDSSWKPTPLKLSALCQCPIFPLHLSGSNPPLYQWISQLGSISKRLVSFRFFLNTPKQTITLTLGQPHYPENLKRLRQQVYSLGGSNDSISN